MPLIGCQQAEKFIAYLDEKQVSQLRSGVLRSRSKHTVGGSRGMDRELSGADTIHKAY